MSTLAVIKDLQQRMSASIIGQEDVVKNLVIGLLANGNVLMEGLPGLAKTRAVKGLAKNMDADFSRIQGRDRAVDCIGRLREEGEVGVRGFDQISVSHSRESTSPQSAYSGLGEEGSEDVSCGGTLFDRRNECQSDEPLAAGSKEPTG